MNDTTMLPSTGAAAAIDYYQDILVGCLLAVLGNMMISVSLNIQKYTHLRNEALESPQPYYRTPIWWIGLTMMALGEVGNFTAYGFAPASVVAPLGTTTVIANMFIAVLFLREKLRPEDLFGCSLAVVGAFLIVSFSRKKEPILSGNDILSHLASATFIVYFIFACLALVVLFLILYMCKKDTVLVLLLITNIIASFTVLSAKAVSGMLNLTIGGKQQWDQPALYVMGFILCSTAVVQVIFLNQAMRNYNSTVVVPTNFVFFTVAAITSGIVFYQEFLGLSPLEIFMFLLGCLMSFVGVYFITLNRNSPSEEEVPLVAGSASQAFRDDLADEDSIPSSGSKVSQVVQDSIPGWLLASVSKTEVQPGCGGSGFGSVEQNKRWSEPKAAFPSDGSQQQT